VTSSTAPVLESLGLRHLALRVRDLESALRFYRELLGFRIVWQPDPDNVYLSSGSDNLALHRVETVSSDPGALDHLGILVASPEAVRRAETALAAAGVVVLQATKKHRDESVSCYVADPDGNSVQILYEPGLSPKLAIGRVGPSAA
jgi:catechol 2,3-dioxygenase-like lactoylglutathione lyase family enzyme